MSAKEIYENETGDKASGNQIYYSEWAIRYRKWLEDKVEKQHNKSAKIPRQYNEQTEQEKFCKLQGLPGGSCSCRSGNDCSGELKSPFIKCDDCGAEYNTRFMDKCICKQ